MARESIKKEVNKNEKKASKAKDVKVKSTSKTKKSTKAVTASNSKKSTSKKTPSSKKRSNSKSSSVSKTIKSTVKHKHQPLFLCIGIFQIMIEMHL